MRVLVACEFSGVVRDAFAARGHEAVSCDLEPCEKPYGEHRQGDVRNLLHLPWDLLIAHPPCTYLCNSGAKHLYQGGRICNGRDLLRWAALGDAAAFINDLLDAPIPRICIENPVMLKAGQVLLHQKYAQIVQPYWFGVRETKATCLWLKGLPRLQPTAMLDPPYRGRVHFESPGPDRWQRRSRTLPEIADAMAEQWGGLE